MSLARLGLVSAVILFAAPSAIADPSGAAADTVPEAVPDVQNLLFAKPQWTNAPAGTTITYSYTKKTDGAYGASFDDKIVLKLEKGDDDASRVIDVRMFSGDHTKAAGPFRSTPQNPVLLLALEANVEDISKAWHANPRYLKDAIRAAWRGSADIEPEAIEVGGKLVPGTRITVQPFANDSHKADMNGLETMVYTVEVADSVPGAIALVDIYAPAHGPRVFSEVLRYQSANTTESAK